MTLTRVHLRGLIEAFDWTGYRGGIHNGAVGLLSSSLGEALLVELFRHSLGENAEILPGRPQLKESKQLLDAWLLDETKLYSAESKFWTSASIDGRRFRPDTSLAELLATGDADWFKAREEAQDWDVTWLANQRSSWHKMLRPTHVLSGYEKRDRVPTLLTWAPSRWEDKTCGPTSRLDLPARIQRFIGTNEKPLLFSGSLYARQLIGRGVIAIELPADSVQQMRAKVTKAKELLDIMFEA